MLIPAANQKKLKLLPIYIIDKYRRVSAVSPKDGKAEIQTSTKDKAQSNSNQYQEQDDHTG